MLYLCTYKCICISFCSWTWTNNLRLGPSRVRKTHVLWWHCHLESFCASGKFLRVSMKSTIKRHVQKHRFPDGLETFLMVWKVSGSLESFWIVWKVYGWSGKFPDGLESFRMVWKVSGCSRNFPVGLDRCPDGLESFQMVWNISGWSGKFLDGLETFRMFWNFPVHDIMKSNQLVYK